MRLNQKQYYSQSVILFRLEKENILELQNDYDYWLIGTDFIYDTLDGLWFYRMADECINFQDILEQIKDVELLNKIIFHLDDFQKLGV